MDLIAANTLSEHAHPKPLEIICYHAQQCAEKMLKGFLVANSVNPPKKHDLPLLCDMCIDIDKRFNELSDMCDFLTMFGVQPRYPNELEVLDDDAKMALHDARTMMGFFRKHNIATELKNADF
jgi:HEPN domain-containing protein